MKFLSRENQTGSDISRNILIFIYGYVFKVLSGRKNYFSLKINEALNG